MLASCAVAAVRPELLGAYGDDGRVIWRSHCCAVLWRSLYDGITDATDDRAT